MPYKRTIRGLLLSTMAVTLAACSSGESRPMSAAKANTPMPPITEMDAAMSKPAPQPLPLSQSDTLTPTMPTATVTDAAAATMAAAEAGSAAPADPASVEARMQKLEQTVGALRTDYNRIMPAFASLNTTNERIQALLDQIETGTGKRPVVDSGATQQPQKVSAATAAPASEARKAEPSVAAPPAQPAAESEPEAKAQNVAAAAPASGTAHSIAGIRIGEHGTKTRLVFDLSGADSKPEFKYDLDNTEKLLLVDMPASSWTGSASSGGAARSPLIEGWSAQKGAAGGTAIAIQLKKGARVLSTEYLKPEGKDSARLVMDIAAGN